MCLQYEKNYIYKIIMENKEPTSQLCSVIHDMINDLQGTFPEFEQHLNAIKLSMNGEAGKQAIYDYCSKVYPHRFFDILYKNEDIFTDSEINTEFLPNVDFQTLYNAADVSEATRTAIWKYLQLILFSIVGSVNDKSEFGDAASLFSGIDEDDLQNKMKDVFENMEDYFTTMGSESTEKTGTNDNEESGTSESGVPSSEGTEPSPTGGMPQMPNIAGIQDHLQGLFNGKIGSLAKEMAEEISGDFQTLFGDGMDMGNAKSTKDVFSKLIRNPGKIKEIIKKVTVKLEDKMKNGNISKDELMKEASEIMKKMKDMGNGGEFEEMMKNMAKTMGGKGARFNTGAFEQMSRQGENRERLLKKLDERRKAKIVEENNKTVFKMDGEEKQAKSSLSNEEIAKMQTELDETSKVKSGTSNKKKKKKGKGKK